jgi:hypothetical protein
MMELSESEQDSRRTPSATLMKAMEEFGKSEPIDCLVVWIDESGEIAWSQSTRSRAILIGMLDMVREMTMHDLCKERG